MFRSADENFQSRPKYFKIIFNKSIRILKLTSKEKYVNKDGGGSGRNVFVINVSLFKKFLTERELEKINRL